MYLNIRENTYIYVLLLWKNEKNILENVERNPVYVGVKKFRRESSIINGRFLEKFVLQIKL